MGRMMVMPPQKHVPVITGQLSDLAFSEALLFLKKNWKLLYYGYESGDFTGFYQAQFMKSPAATVVDMESGKMAFLLDERIVALFSEGLPEARELFSLWLAAGAGYMNMRGPGVEDAALLCALGIYEKCGKGDRTALKKSWGRIERPCELGRDLYSSVRALHTSLLRDRSFSVESLAHRLAVLTGQGAGAAGQEHELEGELTIRERLFRKGRAFFNRAFHKSIESMWGEQRWEVRKLYDLDRGNFVVEDCCRKNRHSKALPATYNAHVLGKATLEPIVTHSAHSETALGELFIDAEGWMQIKKLQGARRILVRRGIVSVADGELVMERSISLRDFGASIMGAMKGEALLGEGENAYGLKFFSMGTPEEGKEREEEDEGVDPGVMTHVRCYYRAKEMMAEGAFMKNRGQYREGFDQFVTALERIRGIGAEDARAAVRALKREKAIDPGLIDEFQELLFDHGAQFEPEHRRMIREGTREMVALLGAGSSRSREELINETIGLIHPLSYAALPSDMDFSSGTGREGLLVHGILSSFACKQLRKWYGLTCLQGSKRGVFLDVVDNRDPVIFLAALKHELIHLLSPFPGEVPATAVSAVTIVGERGISGLGDPLHETLFVEGINLVQGGELISDHRRLETAAFRVAQNQRAGAGAGWQAVMLVFSEDVERMTGMVLGGQAYARALQEGAPGKALSYILSYSRGGFITPMVATDRERKKISRLLREFQKVGRVVTGDLLLNAVIAKPTMEGGHEGWTYDRELHVLRIPLSDLVRFPEESIRGLFFEVLFRILYHDGELIEADLQENPDFCALLAVMSTPLFLRLGLHAYPGAGAWVAALRRSLYHVEDAEYERWRFQRQERCVQFLEGALFEARTGAQEWRGDEVVTGYLAKTREIRERASVQQREELCYGIVRNELWPLFQELLEPAREEGARDTGGSAAASEEEKEGATGRLQGMATGGDAEGKGEGGGSSGEVGDVEAAGNAGGNAPENTLENADGTGIAATLRNKREQARRGRLYESLTALGAGALLSSRCKDTSANGLSDAESGGDAQGDALQGETQAAQRGYGEVQEELAQVIRSEAFRIRGVTDEELERYHELLGPFAGEISALKKKLELLFGEHRMDEVVKGVPGGEISPESLSMALADGIEFERKLIKPAVECMVSMLVDTSGSMGSSLKEAVIATAIFYETFLKLPGVVFEVYGFSTHFLAIKDFSEKPCAPYMVLRLLEFEHQATNDTGALMSCIKRFPPRKLKSAEVLKLILVITDGVTSAEKIGNAIHLARSSGKNIVVAGIGTGKGGETVKDSYGSLGIHVARIEELPHCFSLFLRKLLTERVRYARGGMNS